MQLGVDPGENDFHKLVKEMKEKRSRCNICKRIEDYYKNHLAIRQDTNRDWPDFGLRDIKNFKQCPRCNTVYTISFSPGGMVSENEMDLWKADPVESEMATILVARVPKNIKRLERLLRKYLERKNAYFLTSRIYVNLRPLIPPAVKMLVDKSKNKKSSAFSILETAIRGDPKSAKLVLDELNKAKINNRLGKVKELIKKCEQLLKGSDYDKKDEA